MNNLKLKKKSKNILALLFLHILHMANFKKLALIANRDIRENVGRDSGDGDGPKIIPPAIFQNQVGRKKDIIGILLRCTLTHCDTNYAKKDQFDVKQHL